MLATGFHKRRPPASEVSLGRLSHDLSRKDGFRLLKSVESFFFGEPKWKLSSLNHQDAHQMNESLEAIKRLIDACTDEDRKKMAVHLKAFLPHHPLEDDWGVDAQTILSAIRRSSDLTKRGVRGIIAEAVFESEVLPAIARAGWQPFLIPVGDWPFDAVVERDGAQVRIQIKLQRLEAGEPKRFHPKYYSEELYVVEVQKTRTGKKIRKKVASGDVIEVADAEPEDTRPYRFGDFDILAVNMHPATRDWTNFRYTVSNWLLPRIEQPSLIEIFQPVPLATSDCWTDDLETCLDWFLKGEKRQIIELRHKVRPRKKRS